CHRDLPSRSQDDFRAQAQRAAARRRRRKPRPRAMRIALAALLAGASLALHAADAPLTVDMKAIRVTDRVYYVQGRPDVASAENEGFNSNAGFVITDDGVVVIDALGTPVLGQALYDAIGWVSAKPVRRAILTHYHADHFYGLGAFKAAGAEVWAQQRS